MDANTTGAVMKKKPARRLPAANPANDHWNAVCAMDRPLTSVERLVDMLCFFAVGIDEETEGLALQEVLFTIKGHLDVIRETRGMLFHGLHPYPTAAAKRRVVKLSRQLARKGKRHG